jgi:hypothetical protein
MIAVPGKLTVIEIVGGTFARGKRERLPYNIPLG